ncbi:hypothetical protein MSG28_014807 [Choristoneura fumiferana]|uniref:Uncharacterized protein n=1 Tax=Choristoneura fumiferana TaxID=7141 RepID=A0ACC0JT38_CHOFU|nr:hypothetical protein MSG28_014807 [Choristoneura fumiferana]
MALSIGGQFFQCLPFVFGATRLSGCCNCNRAERRRVERVLQQPLSPVAPKTKGYGLARNIQPCVSLRPAYVDSRTRILYGVAAVWPKTPCPPGISAGFSTSSARASGAPLSPAPYPKAATVRDVRGCIASNVFFINQYASFTLPRSAQLFPPEICCTRTEREANEQAGHLILKYIGPFGHFGNQRYPSSGKYTSWRSISRWQCKIALKLHSPLWCHKICVNM